MPETNLHQPSLGPLPAAAEAVELAQTASGLVGADRYCLADCEPLAPLARDIASSMTEACLTVHRCGPHDPCHRLGGICLLPEPAGPADGRAGIPVSWTTHDLVLLDWDRYDTYAGTQQAINTAIGDIRRAFAYSAQLFGSTGARLVTGHRDQGPGAGR